MRTTLKYFAILASMASAALISASCASDGPPTAPVKADAALTQQTMQDLHDKYDWIGQYHTDGLAYIYTQLTKGNGKPRSHADLCRIAAKATKEFHKMARHGELPTSFVDPALVAEVCPSDNGVSATILVAPAGNTSAQANISATAVNLIDQITTIASTATTRSAYVNGVQNAEAQAVYLPAAEAAAVIGVGSVALSSLAYWEANLGAWTSINGGPGTAYSVSAQDMASATVNSIAASAGGVRYGSWWSSPGGRGFGRVLGADALSAARTIVTTWFVGPIGWEAAAAGAVFASSLAAISLMF